MRALFVWGRTHSSVSRIPSLRVLWNHCISENLQFNPRAAIRCGENLEKKQVSQFQRLLPANFLPIVGRPNCRRRAARPCVRREVKGKADSQQLDFQRSFVELLPNTKPPADSKSVEASHICGNSRLSENDQG